MDVERVRAAVETYCAKYRRSDLPPIEVSGLYALSPEKETSTNSSKATYRWPDTWPNAGQRGVYFIFGRGGRLLYVGKASMNSTIGGRLGAWFHTDKPSQTCKVVHPGWSDDPMFVATLAVPDAMPFEAPALEEYLIGVLSPPDCVRGRTDEP